MSENENVDSILEIPSLSPEKIQKYMTDCLVENGLDPGLIGNTNENAKYPSEKEEGCYLACMDKKLGLMKEDGSYDENVLFSNATTTEMKSQMKKKFNDTMKKCKIEAGNDVCKLAACINRQPRNFYV